jgi:tetratricopeptide (TPR) repeat protein
MRNVLTFAAGAFLALAAAAQQLPVPRESPGATVRQNIGISSVEIAYHRPAVKGRKIWGGLVPYGEVWRLGANDATTLEISDAMKIAGHDVPAGKYGFFAIPGPETWTLILNKRPQQWGAYFYKAEEDFLRFEVKPEAGPYAEWMTLDLYPEDRNRVRLGFAWEKLRFSIPIEADVDRIVWSRYEAALADPKAGWDAYQAVAQYALLREQRLDEAMVWIDKSIALQESFYNYETKARLLHKAGKTKEALPLLEKALTLSRGKTPKGYQDGLEQTKKEWEGGM